ncbi:hypothetical protein LIER_24021 [Lithospermum erythrorhizon]|uniref:Uncharacterized protein n=1 Tax=Lithospermum erythrorhizon TaxID=34254 RepID=A0AAV3QZV0_LITER
MGDPVPGAFSQGRSVGKWFPFSLLDCDLQHVADVIPRQLHPCFFPTGICLHSVPCLTCCDRRTFLPRPGSISIRTPPFERDTSNFFMPPSPQCSRQGPPRCRHCGPWILMFPAMCSPHPSGLLSAWWKLGSIRVPSFDFLISRRSLVVWEISS